MILQYIDKNLKCKAYKGTKTPRLTEFQEGERLAFAKRYQHLIKKGLGLLDILPLQSNTSLSDLRQPI